jgi:FtsZ-interacting cell division protein YlmF
MKKDNNQEVCEKMAGSASIRKIMNYFWGEEREPQEGYDDGEEVIDEGYDEYVDEGENEARGSLFANPFAGRKAKVVPMPQHQQIEMKISKPTQFENSFEIVDLLKNRNAIVLNLEYVSKDVARRIVDVVSGAIIALDGHFEKVSNSIFVAAPFNYDIVTDNSKDRSESKYAANFIK